LFDGLIALLLKNNDEHNDILTDKQYFAFFRANLIRPIKTELAIEPMTQSHDASAQSRAEPPGK
jgi:hypothetical protein